MYIDLFRYGRLTRFNLFFHLMKPEDWFSTRHKIQSILDGWFNLHHKIHYMITCRLENKLTDSYGFVNS